MSDLFLLEPLDVIASNDPRALENGGYAQPGELHPQVAAGALATQVLESATYFADRNSEKARTAAQAVGVPGAGGTPSLRLMGAAWWNPENRALCLPVPRHLLRRPNQQGNKERYRLRPCPPNTCWTDTALSADGVMPLFQADRALEPDTGFLALRSLCGLLADASDSRLYLDTHPVSAVCRWERRHGHERATTGTVSEGMLYSRPVMRPSVCLDPATGQRHVAKLAVFVESGGPFTDAQIGQLLSLGGDGHQVRVRPGNDPDWGRCIGVLKTAVLEGIDSGLGLLLYLASPAPFLAGWRPSAPKGMTLVGAAVERSITLSGWDVAEWKPKPIISAVPAGAVYFYRVTDKQQAIEFVEKYHFAASLCDRESNGDITYAPYGRQGYGLALMGLWSAPADSTATGA